MDEIDPILNHTGTSDFDRLEAIVSIVVPILFSLIAFIGFIGNILVIITVLCNQQMRNTTNLLILNLSLADLLFVCFCIPATAVDYTLNTWPFSDSWCKIVQYFITCTVYLSIYTLVFMSFDRFVAVVYPVSRIRSERNTVLYIIFLWIITLITNIPVAIIHGTISYQNKDGEILTACTFNEDEEKRILFQGIFFVSSYLLPLIFISILYFLLLLRLWKTTNVSHSIESKRGKKRITRLVLIIVGTFAALWFPIQIILLLKSKGLYAFNHLTVALQIVAHVLAYASSCVNPLLYAFLSENFRKSFRKIISLHPSRHSYLPTPTKATATSATNTT